MPRPLWKGHLAFGLVLIPCELISGESSENAIDLDLIDSRDQERVRYKRVNEKTGKEVPWESIVKGFAYEKGKYVVLTPEDFKKASDSVARGAEIIDFVDREDISPVYFEKPYYLQPTKAGEKGYVLLRETLKRTGRVGIAHLVIQARQHLAALMVENNVLMLITMRWPDQLRPVEDISVPRGNSGSMKAAPRELQMAEQLVEGMHTAWDPTRYRDDYRKALRKVISERLKSPRKTKPVAEAPEESEPRGPFNIMDLLKQSVQDKARPSAASSKRAPKRKAG